MAAIQPLFMFLKRLKKKTISNNKKHFNNLFTTYKQPLKKMFPKVFLQPKKIIFQWFLIGFHTLKGNHLETPLEPFRNGFV